MSKLESPLPRVNQPPDKKRKVDTSKAERYNLQPCSVNIASPTTCINTEKRSEGRAFIEEKESNSASTQVNEAQVMSPMERYVEEVRRNVNILGRTAMRMMK